MHAGCRSCLEGKGRVRAGAHRYTAHQMPPNTKKVARYTSVMMRMRIQSLVLSAEMKKSARPGARTSAAPRPASGAALCTCRAARDKQDAPVVGAAGRP